MRSLQIGATGMLAQQTNVDTISNNIANMNTTAYTKRRAEFSDLLYQNIVRPGDKFEMHSELVKIKGPIVKVHAKGFVDGQLAVEADLLVSLISKPE